MWAALTDWSSVHFACCLYPDRSLPADSSSSSLWPFPAGNHILPVPQRVLGISGRFPSPASPVSSSQLGLWPWCSVSTANAVICVQVPDWGLAFEGVTQRVSEGSGQWEVALPIPHRMMQLVTSLGLLKLAPPSVFLPGKAFHSTITGGVDRLLLKVQPQDGSCLSRTDGISLALSMQQACILLLGYRG
jgi:hypothetical protein